MDAVTNDPIITFSAIAKSFQAPRTGGTVEALRDINLEVRPGEFLSIIGPSGCGKSTLLSLVAGFLPPTSGEILFDGQPITGPSPERGVMFQDYALFPWRTVIENIEFGPFARGVGRRARRESARQLASLVGLTGFEDRYPHELSGGMRQRCALARLLANKPKVWLMDEPLAAVDLQTRIILQDELLRLWGDGVESRDRPTVVFVTHGIDEAVLLADRVVVLARRPGRIKAVIDVALPRPRAPLRSAPEIARIVEQLWNVIRDEAALAIAEEGN
jgi:NitT/TauT family transport system ATP-binding protein